MREGQARSPTDSNALVSSNDHQNETVVRISNTNKKSIPGICSWEELRANVATWRNVMSTLRKAIKEQSKINRRNGTVDEVDISDMYYTRNASLKHASKNAKKKLRIHQIFKFIFLAEKYSYNL